MHYLGDRVIRKVDRDILVTGAICLGNLKGEGSRLGAAARRWRSNCDRKVVTSCDNGKSLRLPNEIRGRETGLHRDLNKQVGERHLKTRRIPQAGRFRLVICYAPIELKRGYYKIEDHLFRDLSSDCRVFLSHSRSGVAARQGRGTLLSTPLLETGTDGPAEGSGGAAFFVIESGEATVFIGGKERSTLKAGDYFGEVALIDQGARMATMASRRPSLPATG